MKRSKKSDDTLSLDDFVNCTEHEIVLKIGYVNGEEKSEKSSVWRFPPGDSPIVLTETAFKIDVEKSQQLGVGLYLPQTYNNIEGLPEDTSTPIIVSSLVGSFIADRPHLYDGIVVSPNTDPGFTNRNESGQITSVTAFVLHKWNTSKINVEHKDSFEKPDQEKEEKDVAEIDVHTKLNNPLATATIVRTDDMVIYDYVVQKDNKE